MLKGGRVHRLLRIGPPKSCQTIPSAAPVTRTPNSDPSTLSGRLSGVADYLGSYKKTFEAAAQAQARLIVQLKDNQPSLLQKVETACASQRPVSSDTSVCTGRNRHETRSAEVFSATRAVAATEWNSLIKSIVRVTREVLHRDAKTGLWSSTSEVA